MTNTADLQNIQVGGTTLFEGYKITLDTDDTGMFQYMILDQYDDLVSDCCNIAKLEIAISMIIVAMDNELSRDYD